MGMYPVAGSTFTFDIPGLVSEANKSIYQSAPTIAAGDFQRSINSGAWTNLDNLPVVTPVGSTQVQVVLSAAETTAAGAGGRISVRAQDAAGAEWCSVSILWPVVAVDFGGLATQTSVNTIDDLLDTEVAAIAAAIDAVPTAAEIWASATRTLTQTAAAVTAAVSGSTLAVVRGVTFTGTLTGLTISASWTKMFLTVKEHLADADTAAIAQVVVSNPGVGTDGLRYLNGASGTSAWASLTVNQAGGTVDIVLSDDATALLPPGSYAYDIKELVGSTSVLLTSGTVTVSATPTLALS